MNIDWTVMAVAMAYGARKKLALRALKLSNKRVPARIVKRWFVNNFDGFVH
ncbi:hypothetical protein HWD31_gp09 [Pantoea phage vB_PagM_SSEM1]|uniref:Uncharacterized protein n=1 Tax=Pantoea phage vB_PagM_SSEM1 TaxID=2721760 RepID=A0A6H0D8K2_9CAUD|nr:hypothetical protein HWD31_gp09 [Pantoea phage vB_PagM_SSEM1]QIS79378.1 hypothetical protein SSEM1_gp09 [Pantoea phage vB_PagM_SSEM1]